jgi:hypothetical protein
MTFRRLLFLAFLPQLVPGLVRAQCATPAFTTSDPNGGWSAGGYYVHNNMWNIAGYQVSETLRACAHDNWYVVAKMDDAKGDGAVKTYPNVHKDYDRAPIASFNHLWSAFAAATPQVGIYNVSFDLWLNGIAAPGSNEVMIWTENHGQVPAGRKMETVALGGRTFDVWKTNTNAYIAFVPAAAMASGKIDLLEILKWTASKGWIPDASTLGQICYGIEIVSTNGAEAKFAVTEFSLNTTPLGIAGRMPTGAAVAKGPAGGNRYFSLTGRRLAFGTFPAWTRLASP